MNNNKLINQVALGLSETIEYLSRRTDRIEISAL